MRALLLGLMISSMVFGCAQGRPASSPPDAHPDPADADLGANGAAEPMPLTGLVDEETFKRLHELRPDAASPARGTTVEIAGSKAYLSLPDGATPPLPAVVVIHEWWGLNDHI